MEGLGRKAVLTFNDVAELEADQRGELDAGRWVPVTGNTWLHGKIVLAVGSILYRYAEQHEGWSVSVGDPGIKLRHDPDTLRCPDVAIIRAEREPTGRGVAGWLEGAPDVAIEILGDAQTASELTKKALEYLASGASMVWVLDPEPRRLMLFTPPSHVRVLGPTDTLDGGSALPGFSCVVSDLFGR